MASFAIYSLGQLCYVSQLLHLDVKLERNILKEYASLDDFLTAWTKTEQDAKGRERFLKSGSGRTFLKKQLAHYLGTKL